MANKKEPKEGAQPASVQTSGPRGFAPGVAVRLADGREGKLIREAQDSVPPGWVVTGIAGAVAEAGLTLSEQ